MREDSIAKIAALYAKEIAVAKAIGVAPQNLREQAKDEPEKLGFNVIVVGTSIRIPRIPFLNYILGSNPMKGTTQNGI